MCVARGKGLVARCAALGGSVGLLFVLALAVSPSLWAQGISYLTGYVQDPSGAGVPNASVTIRNEATQASLDLKTTGEGVYRSPALEVGTYEVTVKAQGFQTSVTRDVAIQVGQPRGLNISLQLGTVAQQVEVTAAAPALNTEDAGLGQNVGQSTVAALPYFNRSAGALLALAPTVRYAGEDVVSYGASRYNIGGMTNVNVYVDGGSVNGDREDVAQMVQNPSVEALQQVKITENVYSSQYGRDVGPMVQMETKSGSNALHGGIYYYNRNEAFDTYQAYSDTKPVDRQNMFGGTIGGAIRKDKAFFFDSFEGQNNIAPYAFVGTVPTAAEKGGNFGQLLTLANPITIYDPATTCGTGDNPACATSNGSPVITRQAFANNVIPTGRYDSVANNLLKYFPNPNASGVVNNLDSTSGTKLTQWHNVTRLDYSLSEKDRLSGVWMLNWTQNLLLGVPQYNAIDPGASPAQSGFGFRYKTQSYNIFDVHTFSPNLFMSNRFVYRPRYISRVNPAVNPAKKYAETIGIKNYPGALMPPSYGGDLGFPSFSFTGYTVLGPGSLLFQEAPIREGSWSTDLTYVHGKHTYKGGFEMEYGEHGAPDQGTPTGSFGFTPFETSQPYNRSGGDAFASTLLGLVDTGSGSLSPRLIWEGWYYGLYYQDDYKATSKLTFNMGVRWDLDSPVREVHGYGNSFDFNTMNPISGTNGVIKFLQTPTWPYSNYYNMDKRRFAPRVGFAWQLLPKTVLRGGYGIFNTSPILGANRRAPDTGFDTTPSFSSPDSSISPIFLLQNGFPAYPICCGLSNAPGSALNDSFGAVAAGTAPTTGPSFVSRNWKMGYSQNFTLSAQRELPWGMVLEVAGQGVLGRNLPVSTNWNETPPAFWGVAGGPVFSRRPFPQFSSVTEVKAQRGTTNYYDGYAKLEKHFNRGFNLIANYSYGRVMGNMSGEIYDPQLFHGPGAIYDEANGVTNVPYQTATFSWVYQLPFGQGKAYLNKKGPADLILGGWQVGGLLTLLGGTPFFITSGTDSLNCGNCPGGAGGDPAVSARVNLVGSPNVVPGGKHATEWFNPAAFSIPSLGQIGTYDGTLLSPAGQRFDLSLRKNFKITEKYNLAVIGEFFNLTNTPYYGTPNNNVNPNNPAAGLTNGPPGGTGANTTGPYGARQVQIGARIDF
jgi:hypothetical protein